MTTDGQEQASQNLLNENLSGENSQSLNTETIGTEALGAENSGTYDFQIEGMEIDQEALEEAKPIFDELGVTNEQAKALSELYAKGLQKFQDNVDSETETQKQAQAQQWKDSITNDAEIGGKSFKENIQLANQVLDTFGSSEINEAFKDTSIGNNPSIVRLLVRIGKAMQNDKLITGQTNSHTDPAKVFYPTMK